MATAHNAVNRMTNVCLFIDGKILILTQFPHLDYVLVLKHLAGNRTHGFSMKLFSHSINGLFFSFLTPVSDLDCELIL